VRAGLGRVRDRSVQVGRLIGVAGQGVEREWPCVSSLVKGPAQQAVAAGTMVAGGVGLTAYALVAVPLLGRTSILNRPGFDAASFLAKDARHAEEVPE